MAGTAEKEPFVLEDWLEPPQVPIPSIRVTWVQAKTWEGRDMGAHEGRAAGQGGTFTKTTHGSSRTDVCHTVAESPSPGNLGRRTKPFFWTPECFPHALQKFLLTLTKDMSVLNSTHLLCADRCQRQKFYLVYRGKDRDARIQQPPPTTCTDFPSVLTLFQFCPKFMSCP